MELPESLKDHNNYLPMLSVASAIAFMGLLAAKHFGLAVAATIIANPFTIPAFIIFNVLVFAINQTIQNHAIRHNKGTPGTPGVNGQDANFADLLKDHIKSGTITKDTNYLYLELSSDDYKSFTSNKNENDDDVTLFVSTKDKKDIEVTFKHITNANANTQYKVALTKVGGKTDFTAMQTALNISDPSQSLTVKVAPCTESQFKSALSKVAVEAITQNKQIV